MLEQLSASAAALLPVTSACVRKMEVCTPGVHAKVRATQACVLQDLNQVCVHPRYAPHYRAACALRCWCGVLPVLWCAQEALWCAQGALWCARGAGVVVREGCRCGLC